MAEETKEMQVQEQELVETDGTERMRDRVALIPRTDIYETDEQVVILLDLPGAMEETIDISLEKKLLTINAVSTHGAPGGYSLAFAEFSAGDYERSFRVTDQINSEGIEAVYKDGVLKLTLPKVEEAKARKISVNVE